MLIYPIVNRKVSGGLGSIMVIMVHCVIWGDVCGIWGPSPKSEQGHTCNKLTIHAGRQRTKQAARHARKANY